MKGNNSTKARHQDLEGTNLLDQQLSRVQIFGLEVIIFLLFPWTIGNSKLLPFLFIILILCWIRLISQGSQSLKIGLSVVIFEDFIWQSLSKFYFSKLGLWFYNGHERGFFFFPFFIGKIAFYTMSPILEFVPWLLLFSQT